VTDEAETRSAARRRVDERAERLLGPQHTVRITDARAMRALAHEARQRVIEVLYADQRPRTATELATMTGLTASAMSYHLRALAKWGVVERTDDESDARNRPWRASGTSLQIDSSGASGAVRDAMTEQLLGALARRIQAHRNRPAGERAGSTALSVGELWLTAEQAERLTLWLENAILDEHEAGWRNEPALGRVRMAFLWSLLPDPLPGGVTQQPAGGAGDIPRPPGTAR
jgi:predicted transcriptional regulator